MFADMVLTLTKLTGEHFDRFSWHALMENVGSMLPEDIQTVTDILEPSFRQDAPAGCKPSSSRLLPYFLDAAELGPISRPRLYWTTWSMPRGELTHSSTGALYVELVNAQSTTPHHIRVAQYAKMTEFLEPGVAKVSNGPFPTAVRWLPVEKEGKFPCGKETCDASTL